MTTLQKLIPGFRGTCLLVGSLDMLLAGSMFARGVMNSMASFKVPAFLLVSPHYADAMSWVYMHMFMIGVLLLLIGWLAEDPVKKLWAARVLVLVHGVYAYQDIRSSDHSFGNALYQGPESVIPAVIDMVYILLFLRLSFAPKPRVPASTVSDSLVR